MKILKLLLSALLLLSSSFAFAEGKGKTNWAEQAAQSYEKKAAHAASHGETENAKIYKRLAEIKRESAAVSNKGKQFDWSEYHKLKGQLDHGKRKKHAKDKKHAKQKKYAKDKKYEKQKDYKKSKKNHKQPKSKKGY